MSKTESMTHIEICEELKERIRPLVGKGKRWGSITAFMVQAAYDKLEEEGA